MFKIERKSRFTDLFTPRTYYRSVTLMLFITLLASCSWKKQDIREDLRLLVENGKPEMYYHWNAQRAEMYKVQADTTSEEGAKLKAQYLYWTELVNAGLTEEAISELTTYLEAEGGIGNDNINRGNKLIYELLAVAYLRLGEQQNCIDNHSAASCIIPFDPSVIHGLTKGSENAIRIYEMILDKFPNDLQSQWLLNVAHMTLGHDSTQIDPDLYVSFPNWEIESKDFPKFENIAIQTGTSVNGLSGGTCIDDFNNDGFLDIFSTSYGMSDQVRLLINDQNGGFDDKTEASGLLGITGGLNAIHADFDNDGFRDVFVLRGGWLTEFGHHPNSLLRNNGDGTFEDVTYQAGLTSKYPTQTAAWADFNNDGHLDLFIGNESFKPNEVFCELYQNNGDGTFTNVTAASKIVVSGIVKGVAWGDMNNDGWQDLYISVLGGGNRLYRNEGGTFKDIGQSAGVRNPNFSFPCWFWDFNNDGQLDILVASYEMRAYDQVGGAFFNELKNNKTFGDLLQLYRNNGDETFTEVSEEVGLKKIMHAMGSNFGDLDNDGFQDFYVGTGAPNPMSTVPNRMFHNLDGKQFEEVTSAGGFGHLQKGHGVSFADIDNDGDQDIYTVMGGAFEGDTFENVLYENPGFGNNWISLDLEGKDSNRDGIGARIEIKVSNGDTIQSYHTIVSSGGSFGSSSLRQELGIGSANQLQSLSITWPSGLEQTFSDVEVNEFYALTEGNNELKKQVLEKWDGLATPQEHKHH